MDHTDKQVPRHFVVRVHKGVYDPLLDAVFAWIRRRRRHGKRDQPAVNDITKKRQPDTTLAKEKLGWSPTTELEDGLLKTIKYFEQLLS